MDIPGTVKRLICQDPFYGHISLGINKSFSTKIDTACAAISNDCINIELFFNKKYCTKLSEDHQVGVMQHELMHVCLQHLTRMSDFTDKSLFNIAADMCINQYIPEKCVHPSWVLLTSFPGLTIPPFKDTKFYYDFLQQNSKSNPSLKNLLQALNNDIPTICSHKLWEEIPENIRDLIEKQIEHQMKEVYENVLNKDAGSIPGYLRDMISDMYKKVPPAVDWKVVLRRFNSLCTKVNIKKSKRKINLRYPDNAASKIKLRNKILVVVDTSGSVQNEEISMFFDQIDHIFKGGTYVDVIECDANIGRIYSYVNKKTALSKLTGGGGTMFAPALEFLQKSKEHTGAIFCTDGYPCDSPSGTITKKVLWIITPNGTDKFDFLGPKIKMKVN